MADGGDLDGHSNSATVAYLVQNVYRDLIIRHIPCGRFVGRMCIPAAHDIIVEDIHADERDSRSRRASGKFLDYLRDHGDTPDYSLFSQLLNENGYIYVAKLLRGDETIDPDIHEQHYRHLQFFTDDIINRNDFTRVRRRLIEEDFMDDEDAKALRILEENKGPISACRWLLAVVIPRRKENWLKQFLQILMEEGDRNLVELIDDRYKEKYPSQDSLCEDGPDDQLQVQTDTEVLKTCTEYPSQDFLCEDGPDNQTQYDTDVQKMCTAETCQITDTIEKPETNNNVSQPSAAIITSVRPPEISQQIDTISTAPTPVLDPIIRTSDTTRTPNVLPDTGVTFAMNILSDDHQTKVDKEVLEDVGVRKDEEIWKSKASAAKVGSWIKTQHFNRDANDDVSVGSEERNDIDLDEDPSTLRELQAHEEKTKPLENRAYQEELAREAKSGKNVIIIAPTGCGKTVVALHIMQEHLLKRDRGKTAFFANELTLVDQQYELCAAHLGRSTKVTKIIGETKYKEKKSTKELIDENDVLVMTPQMIVDALGNKALECLSMFTLFIFDECHHVKDKHPTNQIMSFYMDMKHGSDTSVKLPQVVGFTASVGAGKSAMGGNAHREAANHIRQLCANLDATGGLVTVKENVESLKEYANDVEQAIEKTPKRETDLFKTCIETTFMDQIEAKLKTEFEKAKPHLLGIKKLVKEINPCQEKGSARYSQWLGKLYSEQFLRIKAAQPRRCLMTCVQHLRMYNKALLINADCRGYDAMKFVQDEVERMRLAPESSTEIDKWLFALYEENRETLQMESRPGIYLNPKLVLLKTLISKQIALKRESKILVLVKTRYLAHALVEWMKEDHNLANLFPDVVTGCGATVDQGGMSRTQQVQAVQNFKWGKCQVAVATSVAEEGMDVTTCTRVIRYEYVSNEIGMVQARGRASRVKDGTYHTVTDSDEVAKKEKYNLYLEEVMNNVVGTIQDQFANDPDAFDDILVNAQKKDKATREAEKLKQENEPKSTENYRLKCYQCQEFAFNSEDIRVVADSHRLVVAQDIQYSIKEEKPEKEIQFDSMKKVSKVSCKECSKVWGSGVLYKGKKYLVISIINFMAYPGPFSSYGYNFKKWKFARFKCPAMTEEDERVYQGF